jgi:hypothetical protein
VYCGRGKWRFLWVFPQKKLAKLNQVIQDVRINDPKHRWGGSR